MDLKVNDQFAAWAKAPSGFDGGNRDGAIWFCGIEWGEGETAETIRFDVGRRFPSVQGSDRAAFLRYQYNWKLAKLYAAILGYSPAEYAKVFDHTTAFSDTSDTCKLNLYPIAFKNTDESKWEAWLYERTGLPTKALYAAWCQLNRFPVFADWVVRHQPKAIVCTGLQWSKHFLMAFAGIKNAFQEVKQRTLAAGTLISASINDDNTILFVTPFLGQGGLISDAQLQAFGKEIAEMCRARHGDGWCRYLVPTS